MEERKIVQIQYQRNSIPKKTVLQRMPLKLNWNELRIVMLYIYNLIAIRPRNLAILSKTHLVLFTFLSSWDFEFLEDGWFTKILVWNIGSLIGLDAIHLDPLFQSLLTILKSVIKSRIVSSFKYMAFVFWTIQCHSWSCYGSTYFLTSRNNVLFELEFLFESILCLK